MFKTRVTLTTRSFQMAKKPNFFKDRNFRPSIWKSLCISQQYAYSSLLKSFGSFVSFDMAKTSKTHRKENFDTILKNSNNPNHETINNIPQFIVIEQKTSDSQSLLVCIIKLSHGFYCREDTVQ